MQYIKILPFKTLALWNWKLLFVVFNNRKSMNIHKYITVMRIMATVMISKQLSTSLYLSTTTVNIEASNSGQQFSGIEFAIRNLVDLIWCSFYYKIVSKSVFRVVFFLLSIIIVIIIMMLWLISGSWLAVAIWGRIQFNWFSPTVCGDKSCQSNAIYVWHFAFLMLPLPNVFLW